MSPAPWQHRPQYNSGLWLVSAPQMEWPDRPDVRNAVATVEHEADARLIAAAPALLQALKDLMRETDNGTHLCAKHFADSALLAISLAEGRDRA